MDSLVIVLRIVHVGAAMAWFGGAIVGGFFLFPAEKALGSAAQPFMDQLNRRRIGVYFPIVATLAILSGAALFWRDSNGFESSWVSSPSGLAFGIGGLAAIVAFVGGMILIGPSVAAQSAVRDELATTGGELTEEQRRRLEQADGRMKLANRIDLPLLLLAGLMMAIARYL